MEFQKIITKKETDSEKFISETVAFYNEMHPEGFNLFKKIIDNDLYYQQAIELHLFGLTLF